MSLLSFKFLGDYGYILKMYYLYERRLQLDNSFILVKNWAQQIEIQNLRCTKKKQNRIETFSVTKTSGTQFMSGTSLGI